MVSKVSLLVWYSAANKPFQAINHWQLIFSSLIITGTSGSLEICPTLNLFKQTEVQLPINLKQRWMRLELKRELVSIAGNDSFDWGKYDTATVTQTARYKLNFRWVFFVSFPYTYYISYMRWFQFYVCGWNQRVTIPTKGFLMKMFIMLSRSSYWDCEWNSKVLSFKWNQCCGEVACCRTLFKVC